MILYDELRAGNTGLVYPIYRPISIKMSMDPPRAINDNMSEEYFMRTEIGVKFRVPRLTFHQVYHKREEEARRYIIQTVYKDVYTAIHQILFEAHNNDCEKVAQIANELLNKLHL